MIAFARWSDLWVRVLSCSRLKQKHVKMFLVCVRSVVVTNSCPDLNMFFNYCVRAFSRRSFA